MSEFVHLHLHTEFSLLDGACRIDELLDEAVALKMPAIAVTEHGNMFSSVVFHDHARARGLNPILGCEVYVAPGEPAHQEWRARRDTEPPGAARREQRGLSQPDQARVGRLHRGFYYKPRIDKELLAQHAKGLIGLSSCLKGEVAEGLTHQQEKKRSTRRRRTATFSGPAIFSRDAVALASRSSAPSTPAFPDSPAIWACPWCAPTMCTTCATRDAHPHDVLLCIGTGKGFNDPSAALRREAVLPEDCRPDGGHVQGLPGRCRQHGADCGTLQCAARHGINHLPTFAVPPGFTVDTYFEHMVREGFSRSVAAPETARGRRALKHTIDEYERRLDYELDVIRKTGFQGYS
jgi:DNA polymerase-3 subunit alpha